MALLAPALALALAATGDPAWAQGPRPGDVTITVDELPENRYIDVVQMLDQSGYRIISINRTFLNRIRIRAESAEHLREIIFSPSSGEIMRDVIIETYMVGRAHR
jgi:hypothetical protein